MIHRIAVTRARCDQRTKVYIERKKAEGKTIRDAIRCLKRQSSARSGSCCAPTQTKMTPSLLVTS